MNAAIPYKHSGKLGGGLVMIPVVGGISALVLGFLFGYIGVYNPLIGYVSVLLPFGYGLVIGLAVYMAARMSRCRSGSFVGLAGFGVGLLALYTGWVVFVYALLNRYSTVPMQISLVKLFFTPGAVWEFMKMIAATGWFSIFKSTPSGIVLWIFWGLEAAIVLGVSTIMPMNLINDSVFCENCNKWCAEKADLLRFSKPHRESALMARVTAGDLTVLSELEPLTGKNTAHLRVHTHSCESCSETETFQIKHVTYESSDNGIKEKLEDVTGHIIPSQASLMALQTEMLARASALPQIAPKPAV